MADARASLSLGGGYEPGRLGATTTLTQAIAHAIARDPDRAAVRVGDRTLTYRALDGAADAVVERLADAGIEPGARIAVVARPSLAMPAAIVGVLRAGAAYVPVDPAWAVEDGLSDWLRAVGVAAIVADPGSAEIAARLAPASRPVIVANAEDLGNAAGAGRGDDRATADGVAYLYRTSGSTGRPKVVIDSHRNVLDNVRRYVETLAIGPDDRLSLVQTIGFSGAVSSLFAALVTGACVYPLDIRGDGVAAVRDEIRRQRLTMLHVVPPLFRLLADGDARFDDLRVVRLEGDAAAWSDVERFGRHVADGAVLVNGLGATETGLVRQFFVDHRTAAGDGGLPLGFAVPGVDVEIDDGEIVVVGAHLALGYLDAPERTAAAFATRPDGRRAYRTGDLGRLEPDGCLIGLGRRDQAAKVRGQTVDLPEIERRLRAQPGVREAVAITRRPRGGESRLIAYVVSDRDRALDRRDLRRRLAGVLPAGDVPHAVLQLPALPLDPNGKVDRAALPDPTTARPDLAVPYEASSDPLEARIAAVWSEVLGLTPIGRHDPFFDLGGDSLDAARLALALEGVAEPGVVHDAVMSASTVAELAERLGRASLPVPPTTWFGFHDAPGHPGFYTNLERAGRGTVRVHPVGPLDADRPARSIAAAADAAVEQVRTSGVDGPYHLVGYCYAAVVALEAAHRLQRAGADVASLVLLGIGPTEFPELVDRDALVAVDRGRRLRHRLRAHGSEIRRRPPRAAAGYVALRMRRRLAVAPDAFRAFRALASTRSSGRPADPNDAAIAAHHSEPFDGPLAVVLGRSSMALYTHAPQQAWSHLGRRVEVIVLPGHDLAMLGPMGAPGLVATLRDLRDPVP